MQCSFIKSNLMYLHCENHLLHPWVSTRPRLVPLPICRTTCSHSSEYILSTSLGSKTDAGIDWTNFEKGTSDRQS